MTNVVKSGGRPRAGSLLAAEFRVLELRDQVADLSRELSRLRAACIDVLHALPEDKPLALHRLKYEMAGRGVRRV